MTQNGYRPTVTRLPDEDQLQGVEQHCQRLQGQKRIVGLQAKIKTMRSGWLLVRVVDGSPVRWDDVRMTIRTERELSV